MSNSETSHDLAPVLSGSISKQEAPLLVSQLERSLLEAFPREDAESWDRMGLIVGNPADLVRGVLVALDPTFELISVARERGANVILTHHPVFLDPPSQFGPANRMGDIAGEIVWEAASSGISLMNIHTALDASEQTSVLFPELLHLDFMRLLQPLAHNKKKGYGHLCKIKQDESPMQLDRLAARCVSIFACAPRVWGSFAKSIRTVLLANGSANSIVDDCIKEHVDCLICGELRYHSAHNLSQSGVAIIELGHDVSENPLTILLARAVKDAGVDKTKVSIYQQGPHWETPDARRA